jgi:hypothetical protein
LGEQFIPQISVLLAFPRCMRRYSFELKVWKKANGADNIFFLSGSAVRASL